MSDENYRSELRNHFMGQMKSSKFNSTGQGYKRNSFNAQQKMDDFESAYNTHRRHAQQQQSHSSPSNSIKHGISRPCNGDGDHLEMPYIPQFNTGPNNGAGQLICSGIGNIGGSICGGESCRQSDAYSVRQRSSKGKDQSTQMTPLQIKYPDENINFLYETDSNMEIPRPSDESSRSMKSSKTVVSKKSSRDLRKIVKSQCKLHEVIDETLKQMCHTDDTNLPELESDKFKCKDNAMIGMQNPVPVQTHCKRCAEKLWLRSSEHDLSTDIADEVVNSKVINPMIRKLQRMYVNNLREEMSLMEDLERLPHKVNEVYRAAFYKRRE